jgi:hypothetical protein
MWCGTLERPQFLDSQIGEINGLGISPLFIDGTYVNTEYWFCSDRCFIHARDDLSQYLKRITGKFISHQDSFQVFHKTIQQEWQYELKKREEKRQAQEAKERERLTVELLRQEERRRKEIERLQEKQEREAYRQQREQERLEEKRQREAERQAKEEAERLAREQEEAKWKPRPFKL